MRASAENRFTTAKVLVFPNHMANPKAKPNPQPAPSQQTGGGPQPPNIWVKIAVAVSALSALFTLGGILYTVHVHNEGTQKTTSDEHIGHLIDEKVNAAQAATNQRLGKIDDQVAKVIQQLGQLQGTLHIYTPAHEKPKATVKQSDPNRMAESSNPDKALTGIRASLKQAQDQNRILPDLTLIEYKKKVQTLPTSAADYWATAAAIINYQSYVNQIENKAPDPLQVAKPCLFLTQGLGSNNVIEGPMQFSNCVVDLDGTQNLVQGAVFVNSVIQWHGGPVTIQPARFINCRFIIDITTKPANPDLLQKLLASDQTNFTLSATG